ADVSGGDVVWWIRWWGCHGFGSSGVVVGRGCGVGTKLMAARGGEWCGGSYRSGEGEYFWGSPEKFFGGGGGGNPQQDLKDKGVIDIGCSRYMTGNKSCLTDYEEIDGGFVTFGEFMLTDESHVLLKVPRKDNTYSVDLNNVVPQG
nr:hypothetical protein [Tanacetum cinerariifolium]